MGALVGLVMLFFRDLFSRRVVDQTHHLSLLNVQFVDQPIANRLNLLVEFLIRPLLALEFQE